MREDIKIQNVSGANKRFNKRVELNSDLYYPQVNNESIYKKYSTSEPLLETINLSEGGISFKGKVPLKVGDLINFTLAIENKPSFWCTAKVKWVDSDNGSYITGCEFLALTQDQVNCIKEYVNKR
jgi:hypothetical protein